MFYNSEAEVPEQDHIKVTEAPVKCESANTCDYNDDCQVGLKSEWLKPLTNNQEGLTFIIWLINSVNILLIT